MTNEAPPPLDDPKLKAYILNYSDLKFEKVIGTGAAGEVSVGEHIPTRRKIAIKKLHDTEVKQNDLLFRREIYSLIMLKHSFLLPFVGFTNSSPYCIVTKYISGGSLFSALRQESEELTGTQLSIIAYGIASGMKYLHAMRTIHRDLKTQNILLDDKKFPVICDFGTSKQMDSCKSMTGQCGTPNYMAPEFIKNEHYDQSVDVYSFGMILWEMLTGETPYGGKEPPQIIYLILSNHVLEIPEDTPEKLANLIQECWSQDPSQRPPFTTIAALFESGDIFFPETDHQEFEDAIYKYTEIGRRRPSGSKSNSCSFISPLFPQINSQPKPGIPRRMDNDQRKNMAIRSNMTLLANSYIGGISTGTDQQIKQSIDFFEAHAKDPELAQLEIWPKLLPAMLNIKPSLLPNMQKLVEHLAQSQEMLGSIVNVKDLHRFIRPETFGLFLYVINFVPQTINDAMVKSLFPHTLTRISSEKAIILLCKILTIIPVNSNMSILISRFFAEDAMRFANLPGGHLVLKTLLNDDKVTNQMLQAFAASSIKENIVAAYECSFSYETMPELFTLDQILSHMVMDDVKLRNCALEFILRFGHGANGQPLIELIDALLKTIFRYENEQAILLLCRIAADQRQKSFLLKSGIVELWLQISPNKAPSLLRVFILLFNDHRLRQYLIQYQCSASFLANILHTGDNQAFLCVCWILSQMNPDEAYASWIDESSGFDSIANRFESFKNNYESFKLICLSLIQLSKVYYSSSYNEIVAVSLRLIYEKISASKECLVLLQYLCRHIETHQTFMSENAIGVFSKCGDEGKEQIRTIMSLLQSSGAFVI